MIKKLSLFILVLIFYATAGICMGKIPQKESAMTGQSEMAIKSKAFLEQQYIPDQYTFKGADVNPPLTFENVPKDAKSLVLIIDDPDASSGSWIHWLIFNIPPQVKDIKENEVPKGAKLGTNSFKRLAYGGPAPPRGPAHHYFFMLYALDTVLNLKEGANKREIEEAMQGHVLAEAKLVGLYKR
jgi:Raf kinase inhibitor-like YbhB/YbcL family protein